MLIFPSLSLFSQDVNPPPRFCFKMVMGPLFTFNFHRPRRDCKSGLSICLRYHPFEYRLEPCNDVREQSDDVYMENEKVHYSIYLTDEYAFVSLPAELAQAPGFEGEDMGNFHVDDPHLFFRDEKTGMIIRFKEGVYPVREQDGRLDIRVDTRVTYETSDR